MSKRKLPEVPTPRPFQIAVDLGPEIHSQLQSLLVHHAQLRRSNMTSSPSIIIRTLIEQEYYRTFPGSTRSTFHVT